MKNCRPLFFLVKFPLSLAAASYELYIYVSVRLLTIKISQKQLFCITIVTREPSGSPKKGGMSQMQKQAYRRGKLFHK